MKKLDDRRKDDDTLFDIHVHNVNINSREIYLHGYYAEQDEEPGVDWRMSTTFIKNLNILNSINNSPITVHMHTVGGSWLDGMAMFNSIQFSPSPVVIITYAEASSMSGVLLQSAYERVLMPDCEFLIHHGWTTIANTSQGAVSMAEAEKKAQKRMLEVFAERAMHGNFFKQKNWEVERIMTYIDSQIRKRGDWIFGAVEAVDMGFADGIMGQAGYENIHAIMNWEWK